MNIKYKAYPFSERLLAVILSCFLIQVVSYAQIVTGEQEPEEKKEKEKEKKEKQEKKNKDKEMTSRDSLSGTTYYVTGMANYGYRYFTDNSVYGSYAEWNKQTAALTGGGSFGVIIDLNDHFSVDIGVTAFGHKEEYSYSDPDSDSTYYFSNNYVQVGVPIRLRYTIGNRFQFFGFAGLTPVNLINIRFNERYNRADGAEVLPETELIKNKLAIFNVMAAGGLGVTYNFDWIGITLYPEYRLHLFNSYDQSKPLDHRMYGLALNAGFTLRF